MKMIDLLGLSQNAIIKVFTLLEDKDLLRLREICHAANDMVDASILNVRKFTADFEFDYPLNIGDFAQICITSYFDDLRNINYCFLRIALTFAKRDLSMINIKKHDIGAVDVVVIMKMEDVNKFLEKLKSRIDGIQFRITSFAGANSDIIRSCANLFKSKNVEEMRTRRMKVENSDFSPWLELIHNVNVEKVDCLLPAFTKEGLRFLLELADIVDVASISTMEEYPKYLHQCENVKMMTAYTSAGHMEVQIGSYLVETRDLAEMGRQVVLYPIGEECPDDF